MYCQDRTELEDDLYQEDEGDSDGSEVNSELEFHLYSQLHYSNPRDEEEVEVGEEEGKDGAQQEVTEKAPVDDGKQERTKDSWPSSPDIRQPQPPLAKKGEKSKGEKKRKIQPSVRKPSSFLEEVIVIDSGPDIISISDSDTSADDAGVCASKGQRAQRPQTSTPAPQGMQKKKMGAIVSVTSDSSSSESEWEESESKSVSSEASDDSNSSDSDGLENWMILGRENQDGDQSISLNLEGVCVSGSDVEELAEGSWLVSDKDKEAGIYNKPKNGNVAVQRLSNRYYTAKNVQCRNCNKNGHLSKNCPEPKKLAACFLCGTPGHLVSQCPNRHCNNCGLPGHLYGACSERAYWHKQCHRCGMTGHFFDACPEIWRQYHITTRTGVPMRQQEEKQKQTWPTVYCYNCSKKGHYGHECTKHRMFNGTYPSTLLINHYDNMEDINRRKHRLKMKVKELKRNGIFPSSAQTPVTPEPPKKKHKVGHHANNHPPRHTPDGHKHGRNHIFFNSNHEYGASNKSKHEGTGSSKAWKPKRPVPPSRKVPVKLLLDEGGDLPRGRFKGETGEMKKRKKMKMKKPNRVASAPSDGRTKRDSPGWRDRTPNPDSKQEKKKQKKKLQKMKIAEKRLQSPMYPTDENLFTIKQRRGRRR